MREHTPVLLDEVLNGLALHAAGIYVDATFGRGGHSGVLLDRLSAQGRVYALDRDPAAIAAGEVRFGKESRLVLCSGSFSELDQVLTRAGCPETVDGVLFDLGVSSPQLDEADRGFSFMRDGPLDMRMDPTAGSSVAEWLANASEQAIAQTVKTYGEERYARRIARAIVEARAADPIDRTVQLAQIVASAVPRSKPGRHPATRTFQALRIMINDELEQIRVGLAQALARLAPGARLCVISFHSLEDRIVKRFMRDHARIDPRLAKLPIVPAEAQPLLRLVGRAHRSSPREVEANPRARSAVLRVAERLGASA